MLKKSISHRLLAVLCLGALVLGLVPLLVLSGYNHACFDDYRFGTLTRAAWEESHSLTGVLSAAVEFAREFRQSWEGTYTTSFLSSLQPGIFGGYQWTAPLLLGVFLVCLWFFLHQVLGKELGADPWRVAAIFALSGFLLIQMMPCVSEAFFWFNGGVAYLLMWDFMLLRWGVWLCLRRAEKPLSRGVLTGVMVLLTILAGGAKYTNVLFCLCVDGCITLLSLWKKTRLRFVNLGLTVLLGLCLLFSVLAPGNGVRAEAVTSEHCSPVKAIAESLYFGVALMGDYCTLPMLVLFGLSVWLLLPELKQSSFAFPCPLGVTLGGMILYCVQMTPTLYMRMYLGSGRVYNTHFCTFGVMGLLLSLYWAGWAVKRQPQLVEAGKKTGLGLGAFLCALVLLVTGLCAFKPDEETYYGLQNLSGVSAALSLVTGEAQQFDQAMEEREAALLDPDTEVVEVAFIEGNPSCLMGDTLCGEHVEETLEMLSGMYGKKVVLRQGEN